MFQHIKVEVLVVDVNLPGISGPELLEHLRRTPDWRSPPVILVSGQPEQPLVVHALAQAKEKGDPVRFLGKPFDVDDLVDEVTQATATLRQQGGGRSRRAP